MGRLIDLTGQVFGRLTVLERAENDRRQGSWWICKCRCGNCVVLRTDYLQKNRKTDCGCVRKQRTEQWRNNFGNAKKSERLYEIWSGMRQRCNNPKNRAWDKYGGRGIKICEEWEKDYLAFRTWALGNGYADDLSIDRIDNDKGYCPQNCRFTNWSRQERNKRNNRLLTYKGETLPMVEWGERYGIKAVTIRSRLRYGWSVERALTEPVKRK